MLLWVLLREVSSLVRSREGSTNQDLSANTVFIGVTYYITMWYRRHECGFRMAIFFSAATAAGAFGGLLARGINEMSGLGGMKGWYVFML